MGRGKGNNTLRFTLDRVIFISGFNCTNSQMMSPKGYNDIELLHYETEAVVFKY